MKRAFLLIVVPALLVALGLAQTPAASVNTDQTIKGCLGGSNGNYTIMEDGTGHISRITTSSVDFKQHLGHDVTLIGHKASGASSTAADNSFAVTELNMISEHCAAAVAAATATTGTPSETATIPSAAPAAPVTTTSTLAQTEIIPVAPAATTVTATTETAVTPSEVATPPAETVVRPAAPALPPAEITVVPVAAATPPAAAVSTPWDKPAADAANPMRMPAPSRRLSAKSPEAATAPVTASAPVETASAPEAAATPAAAASTPAETAITPAAPTTPVAPARHGALFLMILLAVLVIVLGTLVPVVSRWRKRKLLERTGAQNLSFTREASSDQNKSDQEGPRKAA